MLEEGRGSGGPGGGGSGVGGEEEDSGQKDKDPQGEEGQHEELLPQQGPTLLPPFPQPKNPQSRLKVGGQSDFRVYHHRLVRL